MNECIFCKIISGDSEASVVFDDELVSVFMDIQPINPGHMLIVPKQHAASLADLKPTTGAHMFHIGQQLSAALRKTTLKCEGVNLWLADGAAAFQDVFHIHLHAIPRYHGDGFGFTLPEHYFNKPTRSDLENIAKQIRKTLEEIDEI